MRNKTPDSDHLLDRRQLLTGIAAGAGAVVSGLAAGTATAGVQFPKERNLFGGGGAAAGAVHRSEIDLYDCEVDGDIPADLDGAFYRVGPDPQYPKPEKWKNDIPFDGEGHVSMFRIQNGHVDYKSRYVRNERWEAQHAARKSLFGMYRNPLTDDPSVKGLTRGTANTQIFVHHGKLLALKEDSPPVAMNPLTLETTDKVYTFGGGMKGQTFTAHPKIDSQTGELICFGYEARGLATKDVEIFSCDRSGKVTWNAWIEVPYAGMLHDFGVTEKHITFLVQPLATNMDIIKAGGPHFAWDSTLPTYLGVMRRGGDGKDIRWFKGPGYMATHTMGTWSDGDKVYVDVDGGESNQFPFFPQLHEKYDPVKATGRIMRLTADLRRKRTTEYDREVMYPQVTGALSRQDDRYHTVPYRYGFINAFTQWTKVDHQTGRTQAYSPGEGSTVAEMCFVPRRKGAPEGDGYLVGIVSRMKEGGRSDLAIVDAEKMELIATVKMPYRIVGQVHGFWADAEQIGA